MGMNTASVQRLYVAYFNRPADPVSLSVYEGMLPADRVATSAELQVIAETYFSPSAEYTSNFAGKSNSQIVNQLYQNIFGREAEAAGLVSWATKLTDGSITVAELALELSFSAQGTDAAVVDARIEAATTFTDGLDTAEEITGYSGDAAAAQGRTYLAQIGGALPTTAEAITAQKDTAIVGVDASIQSAVDAGNVVSGSTFTLTASTAGDDFTGGNQDDTFNAASVSRLQDADVLDGGLGTDTLTAKLNSTTTHDATINDIEILNLEVLGTSTITGANIVGATNVNLTGGAVLTYTGHKTEVFDISEDDTGLTLTRTTDSSGGNTVTVTVANDLGTLTLGDAGDSSADGYEYKTVNLVVGGAGSATLAEADTGADQADDGWFASGESIVVTGSGDFELAVAAALMGSDADSGSETAATLDASGHTGVMTLDLGTMPAAHNVSAANWTGVDKIKVALGTSADRLNSVANGTEIIVDAVSAGTDKLKVAPATGSSDAITVTLETDTAGTSIDFAELDADGVETLTINSTGADSSSATITNVVDSVLGTSTDTTLLLTGDKDLTVTGVEATWATVTSTNTAGVDVTVATGGALTFTGGAGDDRIEFDTVADFTSADTLVGGDGIDTLAFSAIPSAISSTQLGQMSGFEIVEFEETNTLTAAVAVDMSSEAGLNEIKFNGALTVDDGADNTYTMTVTGVDGLTADLGAVVNTATGGTATTGLIFVVDGAANAGTNDTVTLKLQDADGNDLANAGFSIDNVENLNINLTGDGDADGADKYTMTLIDGAQLTSIVVTSTNTGTDSAGTLDDSDDLVITALETTLLGTFDASASTGKTTVQDVSAFISTGATITGGSDVDTFTGGVGADTITGNGGNDVLNGDQGNDNIVGGAGDDNINGDVGTDTLTGGAGSDTFVFDNAESAESTMDTITDFEANPDDADSDTLDFAAAVVMTSGTAGNGVVTANLDVKAAIASGTGSETVTAQLDSGLIELSGADSSAIDTLAEWVDVAELLLDTAYVDAGDTLGFVFGGDTYVYNVTTASASDGDADDDVATSNLVKLTGIAADAISATEGENTVHIA